MDGPYCKFKNSLALALAHSGLVQAIFHSQSSSLSVYWPLVLVWFSFILPSSFSLNPQCACAGFPSSSSWLHNVPMNAMHNTVNTSACTNATTSSKK